MTTSGSDFDAAKAVAEQLKDMEKERQQRVLRWVAESLNLDFGIASVTGRRTEEPTTSRSSTSSQEDAQLPHRRLADIKSFVDLKRPKSDVQFATVVAYYYRFEASVENRRESIDADTLQEAARLAGRRLTIKATQNTEQREDTGLSRQCRERAVSHQQRWRESRGHDPPRRRSRTCPKKHKVKKAPKGKTEETLSIPRARSFDVR